MSTDSPRDLIGAFVLGACTAEEGAQVRAHMTADASFRAEVEAFDIVHDALLDVPVVDVLPDVALKRSVMAQVQAEASLFAAAGPDERAAIKREHDDAPAPTAIAEHDAGLAPVAERGAGEPAPSPRRNAFLEALRHPARATALAAVLVALIVGGVVLGSAGGTDGGSSAPREYIGQFTDPASTKQATVKMVTADGTQTLHLHGFKGAGEGRKYQVWLRSGDSTAPTNVLFDVDAKGNATAAVPGDMKDVDDVLVTSEPATGSKTPTREPVFHVQI